jgi:hypothetical protein
MKRRACPIGIIGTRPVMTEDVSESTGFSFEALASQPPQDEVSGSSNGESF